MSQWQYEKGIRNQSVVGDQEGDSDGKQKKGLQWDIWEQNIIGKGGACEKGLGMVGGPAHAGDRKYNPEWAGSGYSVYILKIGIC